MALLLLLNFNMPTFLCHFILFRFILLCNVVFLSSTCYAGRFCSDYLSDIEILGLESIQFSSPAKRPKQGNQINPVKLQKWVEAHKQFGNKYYKLAMFIANHIQIFTQSQFEVMLTNSVEAFLKQIPDLDYVIVVNEGKNKSQFWVAQLVSELASRKPIEILVDPTSEALRAYMLKHPKREILFVDDATYTFESLQSGLNTTFSSYSQRSDNYLGREGMIINIVVAAHTRLAEKFINKKNIILHSSYIIPSARDLINDVKDLAQQTELREAFIDLYSEEALDLVLTGFAHKTADMASVVGISADETYTHLKQHPDVLSGLKNPHRDFGTTVLEGVIMGPDNQVRDTIEILDAEAKPY